MLFRSLGDFFHKHVERWPVVAGSRRREQHARVYVMSLVGEPVQGTSAPEDFIIGVGDDGEDVQVTSPLLQRMLAQVPYANQNARLVQERWPVSALHMTVGSTMPYWLF